MPKQERAIIRLPLKGNLTLRDAASLCESFSKALANSNRVEIDTRGVTSLDVSIVQLFVAARKSAALKGLEMVFISDPEGPVRTVLAAIGLLGVDGSSRTPEEQFWIGNNEKAEEITA